MNIKIIGDGEPLLLIHGWGMSGKIWEVIEVELSKYYRLYIVDLPGMGLSEDMEDYSITNIVKQLNIEVPGRISILGWSLGGLIALKYYKCYPELVTKLFLISTTPCFVNKEGWNNGVDDSVLDNFCKQLIQSWEKTLNQFFVIQLLGLDKKKEMMKFLERKFINNSMPKIHSLRSALQILKDTDLRDSLDSIDVPTVIIAGEKDKLTPIGASIYMQTKIKNSTIKILKNSAHIPFLSHPQDFLDQVLFNFPHKND